MVALRAAALCALRCLRGASGQRCGRQEALLHAPRAPAPHAPHIASLEGSLINNGIMRFKYRARHSLLTQVLLQRARLRSGLLTQQPVFVGLCVCGGRRHGSQRLCACVCVCLVGGGQGVASGDAALLLLLAARGTRAPISMQWTPHSMRPSPRARAPQSTTPPTPPTCWQPARASTTPSRACYAHASTAPPIYHID